MAIVRCRGVFEVALRRESKAFQDAGFDVDVIMLEGSEGAIDDVGVVEQDGVVIRRLRGAKARGSKVEYIRNYTSFLLRASRELAAEHRRRPFDLVHIQTMPDFLVFCTLLARLRGVRVSLFMKEPTPELGYTLYGSRLLEKVLQFVERLSIRRADVVFTVTPELREVYIERGADPDKLHVVLSCPSSDPFENPVLPPRHDPDRYVLISHGTIEERWGHELMVEAIDLVRADLPNVELRLTGSGDYLEEMLRLVEARGLQDHVTYVGWISFDELVAEISGADAGIVAQLANPYSHLVHTQKMYEFIMVDTPCIASRLRATEAAFDDDELLYFEPDDPRSLADAIIRLHASPELGRQLVERARKQLDAGYRWDDQKDILIEHGIAGL